MQVPFHMFQLTLHFQRMKEPVHVSAIQSENIATLLDSGPHSIPQATESFHDSQQLDPWIHQLTSYLVEKTLPDDDDRARKIVLQSPSFDLEDGILYFIDSKHHHLK